MRDHITGEIAAAAAKVTPPLAVSTAVASGLTLQDGVLLATLVYTLVQTSLVIVRGWGDWLGWWAARVRWARGVWQRMRSRG